MVFVLLFLLLWFWSFYLSFYSPVSREFSWRVSSGRSAATLGPMFCDCRSRFWDSLPAGLRQTDIGCEQFKWLLIWLLIDFFVWVLRSQCIVTIWLNCITPNVLTPALLWCACSRRRRWLITTSSSTNSLRFCRTYVRDDETARNAKIEVTISQLFSAALMFTLISYR